MSTTVSRIPSIGNTPLVDLSFLVSSPVRILAKLESHNPTGSVKDRIAFQLIHDAEVRGVLKPGDSIIEPTSGNTGIALAMLGSLKGYKVKAVMPGSVSSERVLLMKAFGAEIIFSAKDKGTNESINVAKEIVAQDSSLFMPYQYGNSANPDAHYRTTGPEIIRDVPDLKVFVAGLGTGGTLMGTGRVLKEYNSSIRVIATAPHPDDVVQGLRAIEDGFIPPILDLDALDGRVLIEAEEAFYWTKRLLSDAGVFIGVSSGAVFATALRVAEQMKHNNEKGSIVALFADGGWKYLSSGIYSKQFNQIKHDIEGKVWW